MKKLILIFILSLLPSLALAQTTRNPCYTTQSNTAAGVTNCVGVGTGSPLPVASSGYASGTTALTGNAAGTTGAVVGTLAAASGKTTYICGFNVSSIGGTAATGPITIAGLITSSMVYQLTSSATGTSIGQTFTPCIPASTTNTAITITTTANGTASAVNVNSWGYRQ